MNKTPQYNIFHFLESNSVTSLIIALVVNVYFTYVKITLSRLA